MKNIEIDKWEAGCKVRAFPWVDNQHYYVNVQYYPPGASLSQPPASEKTVYIAGNDNGYKMLREYLNSLVEYISRLSITPGNKYVLTF